MSPHGPYQAHNESQWAFIGPYRPSLFFGPMGLLVNLLLLCEPFAPCQRCTFVNPLHLKHQAGIELGIAEAVAENHTKLFITSPKQNKGRGTGVLGTRAPHGPKGHKPYK